MTMNNPKLRRRYAREFKEEAVRLLLSSNKPVKELARELGTTHVSLLKWKQEALRNGDSPEQARPGSVRVHYALLEQENIQLKKELDILRQQRDILKKSLGILCEDPQQKGMP